MRERHLAIALSRLPAHPQHSPNLEQYSMEGNTAARWLSLIYEYGDLEGKQVVDLATGNGILGIGALLLGSQSCLFAEIDPVVSKVTLDAVKTLTDDVTEKEGWPKEFLDEQGNIATVVTAEVEGHWPKGLPVDTIIMNPPWGFQSEGADRPLLMAAFASPANTIHLMHSAKATHITKLAREKGWNGEVILEGEFRIPALHAYHSKRVEMTLFKCWRFTRIDD